MPSGQIRRHVGFSALWVVVAATALPAAASQEEGSEPSAETATSGDDQVGAGPPEANTDIAPTPSDDPERAPVNDAAPSLDVVPRAEPVAAGHDEDGVVPSGAETSTTHAAEDAQTTRTPTVPLKPVQERQQAEEGEEAEEAPLSSVADTKPRVILLRLDAANVDRSTAQVVQGLFTAAAAQQPHVDIVTIDDLAKTLNIEAERQALACEDDAVDSCLVEIAGAMGARYLAYGQLGALGQTTFLQLHLFDSDRARSIGRVDLRVDDVEELADVMQPAVDELFAPLTSTAPETSLGIGIPVGGGLLGAAGVSLVVAASGGILFGVGLYLSVQANNRTAFDPAFPSAVNDAWQWALLGNLGSAVGIAGLLGAAILSGAGAATLLLVE
jgi:hypothetical protein